MKYKLYFDDYDYSATVGEYDTLEEAQKAAKKFMNNTLLGAEKYYSRYDVGIKVEYPLE